MCCWLSPRTMGVEMGAWCPSGISFIITVDKIVKIVVIVCLFLSSRVFSRKFLSVIKRHYNPLPDIYLGTTPFLFSSLCQSWDYSYVPPRHCLGWEWIFLFFKHFPVQHSYFSFDCSKVHIFSPLLHLLKIWSLLSLCLLCLSSVMVRNEYEWEFPAIKEEMFYNSCCYWSVHLGNKH